MSEKSDTEVGYVRDNVIYIKNKSGYRTLTINDNTTNEQIKAWGKQYGVDMTPYLN